MYKTKAFPELSNNFFYSTKYLSVSDLEITQVITECYLVAVLGKLFILVVIAKASGLPVLRVFTATLLCVGSH